jgi:hypothetical protein
MLSLASTLGPIGLVWAASAAGADGTTASALALMATAGVVVGPAVGYWTGGASSRGWKGVAIRLGVGVGGTLAIAGICSGDNCPIFGDDDGATAVAALVALAAAGVIVGSAVADVSHVRRHVRQRNERILFERERRARLSLAPVVSPVNGGTFAVVGRIGF